MKANERPDFEKLPSGKTIIRNFDKDRSIFTESHSYGLLDIGITLTFQNGTKIEESYFSKRRLVSRRSYEKARVNYADMPAPDAAIEDWGAEILRDISKERRQHQAELRQHIPNADRAREMDDFSLEMLQRGTRRDAVDWIENKKHTLGELDWLSSRRLVRSFLSLGALKIYACQIASDEYGENTGHLIIELPKKESERKRILKKIDVLAREQGYEGPYDEGQQYVYAKLD